MPECPALDPRAPLQFLINSAAGSSDMLTTREAIESTLRHEKRLGQLHWCPPADLVVMARQLAQKALSTRTALVAVGGDGTLNTVAQAVHAAGCAMGVVPQGTFNYFARTHGIPTEAQEAVRFLLHASPVPVQVAGVNERIFLVNASLGLYPDLLEDRETFKARFGRSRWVALWAAGATLLRAQRQLRLSIEQSSVKRRVHTLTLFVGNNRLQLDQVGIESNALPKNDPGSGRITAVMLRPVGTLAMIGLMLRGAMGTLGEAPSVEHFEFEHLMVHPTLPWGRHSMKIAFDGEVTHMRAPLHFRVLSHPLCLLKQGVIHPDSGWAKVSPSQNA